MAGWWSRLFGRRAAAAAAYRPALEAASEPPPTPPNEPEDDAEISPARLDAALNRLREEISPPSEENP